jgi:hypothetical protein
MVQHMVAMTANQLMLVQEITGSLIGKIHGNLSY